MHISTTPPPLTDAMVLANFILTPEISDRLEARLRDELAERARRVLQQVQPARTTPHIGGLAPWQARRIKAEIEARCGESLRVSDLAARVGLSTSHFSRAFKISFGACAGDYLRARRVERAQGLMLEGRLGLAEIALQCGFSDQAHFSRVFSATVGMPPHRWRRMLALAA
jgi:AraC family transcriptional regulator